MPPPPLVFTGSARWTGNNPQGFSALEQLGVQRDAELDALLKCQMSWPVGCVASAAQLEKCVVGECSASAVASPLSFPPGRPSVTVAGISHWDGPNKLSSLEQLGVQKAAEQNAVFECQKQGLLGCVPLGAQVTASKTGLCEAAATAAGYVRP